MLIGGDLIWYGRHQSSREGDKTNAECNVNNEAKIFRIEIAYAKPAVKKCNVPKIEGYDVRKRVRVT